MLYLTFLVCEGDRLDPQIEAYLEAESILRASIDDSVTTEGWQIADNQCEPISWCCARMTSNSRRHRYIDLRSRSDDLITS